MENIHTTLNVGYLPLPNRVEFIATHKIAPADLTKTAFVVPFIDENQIVIANNVRRGYEIPGGHIEPGEMAIDAARRECLEETGFELRHIIPIGYLKMTSEGEVPEGWKYPHPISYQQFFVGITGKQHSYEENDECLLPVIIDTTELEDLSDQRREIIRYAHSFVWAI
jgi:8-oxo-dGTP pyrophosphatase MutT (NUDIX family)